MLFNIKGKMRATMHQTLTSEAAAVLRNAVGLARRRGHAQATPLHVAATLLACETSLLRQACLHSHGASSSGGVPRLQWRALEVCFNVALNRLPAAVHQAQPSLSNALIAALKRAQAHQRRECIELQQAQPLLGVKVEMEQLVISILDDPSVSRVMREAGFYTTHVKNSVEDTAGISNPGATSLSSIITINSSKGITRSRRNPLAAAINNKRQDFANPADLCLVRGLNRPTAAVESLDMKYLVQTLVSPKRKNTIIVGEEPLYTQSIVRELMVRIQSENVPDGLKRVQFIAPQFSSCAHKADVDRKVAELNRIISNCCNGGVIAYVGDLRWTVETGQGYNNCSFYSYSAVEHVIVEVWRMLSFYGDKLCLLGTATYGTYMQCKMRQPCLESQWKLQHLNVSSAGLKLALQCSAKVDKLIKPSPLDGEMNCCHHYSPHILDQSNPASTQRKLQYSSSKLPCWLRQYKEAETCTVDSASPQAFRSSEIVRDSGLIYEHRDQSAMQQQQDFHFTRTSSMGNCSVMRSFSPQSIEISTKELFGEESPSDYDQNRTRLEVETTLTLGRSSSTDFPNKRNRPSNNPLWSQSTANSPESLSASVGNDSFC